MVTAGESVRRAGRALARGFRLSYDYLGMVLAGSTIWFLIGLVPAVVGVSAAVRLPSLVTAGMAGIILVLLTFPAFTSVVAVNRRIVHGEEVALADFWREFVAHFRRSAGLGAIALGVPAILVVDLAYFVQAPWTPLRLLAGAWVWFVVYAIAVLVMAPAVLVNLERSAWQVWKQTALVVLDNLAVTVLVMLVLLALAVVSVVLAAPLMLLLGGMAGMILAASAEEILQRYRQMERQENGDAR